MGAGKRKGRCFLVGFSGGSFEDIGGGGVATSLSFTGGHAAQLAFQHILREQRCPAGDVWHPGHPPVPRSALPGSEQQQQLPNSITEIQRALCRTGATAARISGLPFSFSFSCKSEKPFWWSLLCCGCPRAIQKHNKKPTLRIPTTAFVHQSSCSQTPNRATNSSAPTAASSQAASRAAGGRSPQL